MVCVAYLNIYFLKFPFICLMIPRLTVVPQKRTLPRKGGGKGTPWQRGVHPALPLTRGQRAGIVGVGEESGLGIRRAQFEALLLTD